jgi:hypothetical protein
MVERFADRFRGLSRAYGIYTIGKKDIAKNKVQGRARTVQGPVTRDLYAAHIKGAAGLGIVPIDDDATCRFGAIDVDIYDGLNMGEIETRIKGFGFPLVICRTKSGGIHLYLFTSEPTPAKLVREKLMEWAITLGFGKVEIFPKQVQLASDDDVGNWINIPYFGGDKTDRYAIRDGARLSLSAFLDYADAVQVSVAALVAIKTPGDVFLDGAPPCLQTLSTAGFPDGTRNNGLFNLGVFARKKYGDDWETKVDEMNSRFMDPPLQSREIQTIIKSLRRKSYSYKCNDHPISGVCNRTICLTREFGIAGNDDDPGVTFGGLVKIETTPPTWIIDVDGVRVELPSTVDLLSQERFRVLIIERMNILPSKVRPKVWDGIIQRLLQRVETIDAPLDAGIDGQFLTLVDQFATDRGVARSRDEIILGKPWVDDGRVYFRAGDLLKFLDQNRFYQIKTARDAWRILRALNAGHSQFNIKGKCVRVWNIPEPKKIDGDLDPPRVDERGDDF